MKQIPDDLSYKVHNSPELSRLLQIIDEAIFFYPFGHNTDNQSLFRQQLKPNENLTGYQREEYQIRRPAWNDRVFPLETVRLQSYKQKHDADLTGAIIHTGMNADEYARSFNALAITIGRNIFFRNGAYKPETEEGRKVLSHELTHIAQYEEGRITNNITKKELELEAETSEAMEVYNSDEISEVEIGGESFLLNRSEQQEVIADAIDQTVRWFEKQKTVLEEKEYFRLIRAYAAWKEGMSL